MTKWQRLLGRLCFCLDRKPHFGQRVFGWLLLRSQQLVRIRGAAYVLCNTNQLEWSDALGR